MKPPAEVSVGFALNFAVVASASSGPRLSFSVPDLTNSDLKPTA